MATWKKVIVSGSDAVLNQLTVGTAQVITSTSARLTGSFTGSFTGDGSNLTGVTATAVFPTSPLTPFGDSSKVFTNDGSNKFISGSQISEYVFGKVSGDITISNAGVAQIAANSVALGTDTTGNYVDNVSAATGGGVDVTGATGEGQQASIGLKNASALSNNTILKWDDTNNQLINTSLTDNGTLISGATSIQLTGTATSLTGSFSGSFYGSGIGSVSNALSLGVGLTNSGSTYNGSQAVTVAVGAGTLITSSGTTVAVKTSNLNEYQIPFYSNGFLSGSNISDSGSTVTIEKSLWVKGNITASGTLSYLNVQNLAVVDQFILLNSGSNARSDAGLLANYVSSSASASAFFIAHPTAIVPGRWAVADAVGTANPVTPTPDEYMVTAKINQSAAPSANPTWGGNSYGMGNMWITNAGDIYIYS